MYMKNKTKTFSKRPNDMEPFLYDLLPYKKCVNCLDGVCSSLNTDYVFGTLNKASFINRLIFNHHL